MSESKKSESKKSSTGKKFPAARLLSSRALSGYQPDFAKVILGNKEYTVQEAKETLDAVLKGGNVTA